jgi:hypothetical protein
MNQISTCLEISKLIGLSLPCFHSGSCRRNCLPSICCISRGTLFCFYCYIVDSLAHTRTIYITLFFIIAVVQSLSLVFFQKIHSSEYLGSEFLIETVRVGGE